MQTIKETAFDWPGQTAVYHGKVRDVYTIGDSVVMVATDRISVFDVILPQAIPSKGQVLNQTGAHFLQATADVAPNWLVGVPDPNASFGHRCEPFKVEMVIRGCLVGHAWREYKAGKRELCGVKLPDGLQEFDAFPEPIITPSTKADAGHDEDISAEQILAQGILTDNEWDKLSDLTRKLFAKGQNMARDRGLMLADTKYEFGRRGKDIYVIDEVHTPDSSRYFYADSYDAYLKDRKTAKPKHFSKEFVREWMMEHGFSGQAGQTIPQMSDDVIRQISARYIELYETLTGKKFIPADESEDLASRIDHNVRKALKETK